MDWFLIKNYEAEIKKNNEEINKDIKAAKKEKNKENAADIKARISEDKKRLVGGDMTAYPSRCRALIWIIVVLALIFLGVYVVELFRISGGKATEDVDAIAFLGSLVLSFVFMLVALILNSSFSRKYANGTLEMYKVRLAILKRVIISVYGEEALCEKVEHLVEFYKDKLNKQEKDIEKIGKIFGGFVTIFVALGTAALANLDKVGITFYDWIVGFIAILSLGGLVYFIYYFTSVIGSNEGRYKVFLNRLLHLQILLTQEIANNKDNKCKGEVEEKSADKSELKIVGKKNLGKKSGKK